MYVKPAEGRAPRCPYTYLRIPQDGQTYPDHDPHIAILLRFGDLVTAERPAEQPEAKSPEPEHPDAGPDAAKEPASEEGH